MSFMALSIKYIIKPVSVIILAGICALGGYSYAMKYQANSILTALPRPMETTDEETSENEPENNEITIIEKNDISAASEGSWNTVDSHMYDITGDGVNDNITLYSSNQNNGPNPKNTNEQNWILEVSDGVKGYYTLLDSSLLHSTVYYDVVEKTSKRKAIIVYETTETGTDIVEYVFTEKGFEEKVTYSSNSAAKVHSSVPHYE